MRHLSIFALAAFAVLTLVAIPTVASAAGGIGTHTKGSATCKSGKQVNDARSCKENGGKR
jgi:hypothetical protein